jgi:uncharacterized membrane protein YfcA
MVLLGLSPAQAIATAKFSGLGSTLGASSRFYKEKLTDKKTVIIFSIIGAISSLGGSLVLVHFSDHSDVLQKLMGIIILTLGVPMLYVRKIGLEPQSRPVWLKSVGLVLLGIGVILQVALGSGVGSLQLVVLMGCFGMTALVASATRRAMQLSVALVSLTVYIATGLVSYKFGLIGFATSLAGGYLGAHIAVKKGNKFVVNSFAVVSALLALQLLLG